MRERGGQLGGIVTLAVVAGLGAAIWTIVTFKPSDEAIEAKLAKDGSAERAAAVAQRIGGFRNAEPTIRQMWREGRVSEATQLSREWARADESNVVAAYWRVALALSIGDFDRARRVADSRIQYVVELTERRPNDPDAWYYRGWLERGAGLAHESAVAFETAAELLRERGPEREVESTWLYNVACYEALRGRSESALDALEGAFEAGWSDVAWMCVDPDLTSVREDERFKALTAGHVVLTR